MKLFERLAGWRTDFTVCAHPSFSRDGEALCKFLPFETEINILHENKTGKALESFTTCCFDLRIYKATLSLPILMAVSPYCAMFVEQLVNSVVTRVCE